MTSPIESSSEDTDAAADVDKHSAYEAESEQEKVFFSDPNQWFLYSYGRESSRKKNHVDVSFTVT
jgi:hypothetical protein